VSKCYAYASAYVRIYPRYAYASRGKNSVSDANYSVRQKKFGGGDC